MNLLPNEQQAEITNVVRAFLADQLPSRRYQDAANRGAPYPDSMWRQLVELGWFGIGVSELVGGMGLGLADEMLLAREAGRQLASPTILGTSVAIQLLSDRGDTDLAAQMITGSTRVAFALANNVEVEQGTVSADISLFDGEAAQYLVACDHKQCMIVEVSSLLGLTPEPCTDESLGMQRGKLEAAPLAFHTEDPTVRRVSALFLVAALAGIAEAARDAASGYAMEREQFGQAIGGFQAISHLCADMAVLAEAAWAQCVYAALALQASHDDSSKAVASAAVVAEKAALNNARGNVQVHGGAGFTVEYDAHYYAKRSHVYRQLLGASLSALDDLVPRDALAREANR